MKVLALLVLANLLVVLSGCASSSPPRARYPVTHAGAVQKVESGTVVSSRTVRIDGRATQMGAIVGAGVGAAVGAVSVPRKSETVITQTAPDRIEVRGKDNRNQANAAMAVGGAVGIVVGREVEKMVTARKAQELTIALDSGETVVVVQELREPEFYENERVKVYSTRMGESRVYHSDENPHLDPDTAAYVVDEEVVEDDEFEPVTW